MVDAVLDHGDQWLLRAQAAQQLAHAALGLEVADANYAEDRL